MSMVLVTPYWGTIWEIPNGTLSTSTCAQCGLSWWNILRSSKEIFILERMSSFSRMSGLVWDFYGYFWINNVLVINTTDLSGLTVAKKFCWVLVFHFLKKGPFIFVSEHCVKMEPKILSPPCLQFQKYLLLILLIIYI